MQKISQDVWTYHIFQYLNAKEVGIFAISNSSLYAKFGGFINILQLAVNTRDHLTLQLATQIPVELSTLLHHKKQDIIASIFQCIPRSIARELSNQRNFVIAGGFVRSLIVKILKRCKVHIKCEDETFGDVDVWFYGNQFHGVLLNDVGLLKIDRISLPRRMRDVVEKSGFLRSIITCFDWTATQASLDTEQKIFVTPASLFSIITGNMYFVQRTHFKWPFSYKDGYLESPSDWCPCDKGVLFAGGQKINLLSRFLKYNAKGYVDPFTSSNEVNRMVHEVGNLSALGTLTAFGYDDEVDEITFKRCTCSNEDINEKSRKKHKK